MGREKQLKIVMWILLALGILNLMTGWFVTDSWRLTVVGVGLITSGVGAYINVRLMRLEKKVDEDLEGA
ncbi:hypothetical protein AKJ64_04005 [candidate division MSBL1 archaeon SCGC-AAA259E17]|uniref:Uncharacterized protein n=1 Tax=candidate division MSBL1 archaeon SCGC-AAA259E17 TaxID=1698263 RepID=A0A133UD51_9EURY|nr:hypothetical protein AKJ64_04005 [candidate division MSBL1 archaeon SCGC-AAA259E17]